jgi:hypothetical protein
MTKFIYLYHRLNLFVAIVSVFAGAIGSLFFLHDPINGFILFALSTHIIFFLLTFRNFETK